MQQFANIEGFVGFWGSGKSLEMVRSILARQKADPYTLVGNNFGYTGPYAVACQSLDDFVTFACSETPGFRKILAMDEIGALARARGHATFPPAADVVFQQGRKLGLSVLWTTQHWKYLDVNIRRVTEKVTECKGLFPKRLSKRGEFPIRTRPRLIRHRVYLNPDPEKNTLPDTPDRFGWVPFPKRAAESYDTMALVRASQVLMQQQFEAARDNPLFDVLVSVTGGDGQ